MAAKIELILPLLEPYTKIECCSERCKKGREAGKGPDCLPCRAREFLKEKNDGR